MQNNTDRPVRRLLLVEDSVSFSYCIKAKLENEAGLQIVLARTLAEAKEAIKVFGSDFFLALLDLNLPDASGDDIVKVATENRIPSIVFTGTYSDELRDRLFDLGAIDYLNKDTPHSLNYVISLVKRLLANERLTALVVDDSVTSRAQISMLLRKYRFHVLEADGGEKALDMLENHRDVRLVITDYNMPGMNGYDLTKAIRQIYPPDRLAIIGVSGQTTAPLSAKFLKLGANDFLNKPFIREEFFCRITQNMDYLDHVQALVEAATRDPLTGIHNRRYFFETAEALASQARRDNVEVSIGMFDIDFFKQINDNHGHFIGDEALKHVAGLIRANFTRGSDIVARFGGEEFCVFLYDTDEETAKHLLEQLRYKIQTSPLHTGDKVIPITTSIGLRTAIHIPIAEMVDDADQALYAAKQAGRNRVEVSGDGGVRLDEEAAFA